ncbi:hypothetical protein MCELHM10_03836 [Paracoccaceae bacterium]|jgi:hypothetical protein
MPGDVFEEDPFWAAFLDDPSDVGPKVPRIIGTAALSGGAEGLAGISGEDDVEGATEDPGIEAAKIIPDRCRGEISCALCGDEDRARPVFPLDECAGVIAGLSEHEAQIKASAACAEGQSVPGT